MQLALMFFGGIVILIVGAEMLVRGSSRLALALGIPPLVVGLTVVAFGTSSPELAVTIQASLAGQADLALGNVVGSNITNILLILGLAAVILPLHVDQKIIRRDVPLMIGGSLVLLLMSLDGSISGWDGILLVTVVVLYTIAVVRASRRETAAIEAQYEQEYGGPAPRLLRDWAINIVMAIAGLALLIFGANWIVESAVAVATSLGISPLVIGLTVVAIGTSLPEIATTIVAGMRGERDIAVGNAIGSCIFNIFSVLGFAAVLSPSGIGVPPAAIVFDLPVMLATAIACLPIVAHGNTIYRWEGMLFLAYYVVYLVYQVLNATGHSALPAFNVAMIGFALPLTFITIIVLIVRIVRQGRTTVAA